MLVLGAIAVVLLAAWAHRHFAHRHAHRTISRAAEKHGWGDDRKVVELRTMKRRHSLRSKARRLLSRRR